MKSRILLLAFLVLGIRMAAQWNPFGSGIGNGIFVIGFQPYQGELLAYTYPAPVPYVWDGVSAWTFPIPQVPNSGGIHRLYVADSVLYAATYALGNLNQFYRYDNGAWVQMGQDFSNPGTSMVPSIYDIAVYHDTLYIAGEFSLCGTDTVPYIAKWADTAWVALGGGLSGFMAPYPNIRYPHSLVVYNDALVVAGNFTHADGIQVNGIAQWNGTAWSGFGDGFNRVAYGMCVHNGDLYVGGEFTLADSNATNCIARWNGTQWENPGIGIANVGMPGVNAFVHSLLSHQGRLVVGGGFNRVLQGITPLRGSGVFIWDGTNIDLMDGGVNSNVEALLPWQSGLLVGGDFDVAGGNVTVNHVAYYDFITAISNAPTDGIRVYPSVAESMVHVAFDPGQFAHKPTFRILDLLGTERISGELGLEVHLDGLATGFYLLQVMDGDAAVHSQLLQKVD